MSALVIYLYLMGALATYYLSAASRKNGRKVDVPIEIIFVVFWVITIPFITLTLVGLYLYARAKG